MTATVSIDISDYLPVNFNFEGFSFNFKTDGYDETIEFSKRNQILAQITNLKKDRKFTVRVLKNSNLVGITEVVLPQMFLIKRETEFSKQLPVSMTDSIKKQVMGKEIRPLQIVVKAKIDYKEDGGSGNAPRSSSAKPISSTYSSSNKKNSTTGTTANNKINARGSLYVVKDKNEKPQLIEIDEFGDIEKSFIDSIFNDDAVTDFLKGEKNLNNFVEDFNEQVKKNEENSDELKEKTKILIPRLFDIQREYYGEFNKAVQTNIKLKQLLVKYNEKYRGVSKKSNRLKEALESNLIRNELTQFINKEENQRIREAIAINNSELNMFKQLFKIDYSEKDILKFKEESNQENDDKEKTLLLQVIQNLFKNDQLMNSIPEEKKIHLSYLASKFKLDLTNLNIQNLDDGFINDKINEEVNEDELNGEVNGVTSNEVNERQSNYNQAINNANQIELNGDEEDLLDQDQKDTNVSSNLNNGSASKRKLSIVKSSVADHVDRKIDNFLVDFYAKKRLSHIPFRRLSQGEYEFGTQKILVKVEGETVRVRTGGGFILLDKFVEINAPLEEAKLLKTQSISDKFKTNSGVNKVIGNDKNVYELSKTNYLAVVVKNGSGEKAKKIKK